MHYSARDVCHDEGGRTLVLLHNRSSSREDEASAAPEWPGLSAYHLAVGTTAETLRPVGVDVCIYPRLSYSDSFTRICRPSAVTEKC
jgi:hypothetical protein